MFGFFKKNREIEHLKQNFHSSFDAVKEDFTKVGKWIKHIDGKHEEQKKDIGEIKNEISVLKNDVEEIKEYLHMLAPKISRLKVHELKQPQTAVYKQTAVEAEQTAVQTAVQTPFLNNLTTNERVIVITLMNHSDEDMRLSYEDLAALLGKDKSTIRGQINALKQKNEGLIEEAVERNGKKRLYIPEEMRNFILKSVKVRVKRGKKPNN